MTLQEILGGKGALVHFIGPNETLTEVVRRLFAHRIGSLLVCEPGSDCEANMLGIITERDILRALAENRASLDLLRVRDYMTSDTVNGSPQDEIAEVMGLMTNRRIRHLPVLDAGRLVGIVSIGDVVKAQHDQMLLENHYLRNYLHGGSAGELA
ncbi:MAG: CBS domain-containing protein [Pirellulales bacterium]|jgi:CBS domain-containing protein|nr:CBS domain-containing protein [Pirellulales bacterium]